MKQKVLIDVKITCDPPGYVARWHKTIEEQVKAIESWVKEFHDFIRDHRSQDPVSLDIERVYEDQCSFCGYRWELDENGDPACCQKAQDELDKNKVAVALQKEKP